MKCRDLVWWIVWRVCFWQPAVLVLLKSVRGTHETLPMNSHSLVLSPPSTGHLAEAQRELAQQRVEEEVCHTVQRRHTVLSLQCQCKSVCWHDSAQSATCSWRLMVMADVWCGRTTCWTPRGKRWTCWEWRWKFPGSDHLVLYLPAALQPGSTAGSKTSQDLRVSAQVKEYTRFLHLIPWEDVVGFKW